MPGSAAKVTITERQQKILDDISRSSTVAARLILRASIILLAFSGLDNQQIAQKLGKGRTLVARWRRRWASHYHRLTLVECFQSSAALRRAIENALADDPRSGSPGKFTPEQITLIFALACEPPEKSGRPITHWTYHELADEVNKRGIVPNISVAQIGRYLREAQLQPHRSRYWLNTTEKDPVLFQAQAEAVCTCYLQAHELFENRNMHTVCVDEMTGLQALERIAATLDMKPGLQERREFEYERHGTISLISSFEVTTGALITTSMGPTRTEEDFLKHMQTTVAKDPKGEWVFVMDNLNIHCSETLVAWVAKMCGTEEDLGTKGKRGVQESMESRRKFLSDASHRIRIVYTPKHSSWLNQIELVFGIIMRKVIRRGSFKSVQDLQDKLKAFIEYFNQVMAKPFRWTFTGRPLTV